MKNIYLALAIVGGIVPYAFFLPFFQANGLSLSEASSILFANGLTGGLTADLLISSAVFWLFMFSQRREGAAPNPVMFILINLFIGLSCALPAYLYARERQPAVAA
jgi:hypothetical protein